ncbi:MAG: hypothetical protein R3E01_19780 [Pirellulaceae bacterium]
MNPIIEEMRRLISEGKSIIRVKSRSPNNPSLVVFEFCDGEPHKFAFPSDDKREIIAAMNAAEDWWKKVEFERP